MTNILIRIPSSFSADSFKGKTIAEPDKIALFPSTFEGANAQVHLVNGEPFVADDDARPFGDATVSLKFLELIHLGVSAKDFDKSVIIFGPYFYSQSSQVHFKIGSSSSADSIGHFRKSLNQVLTRFVLIGATPMTTSVFLVGFLLLEQKNK